MRVARLLLVFALFFVPFLTTGCSTLATTGKVIVTPIAAVRDVVDVPLTATASFLNKGTDSTKESLGRPNASAGWGLGGPTAGFGIDFSYIVGKAIAYTIGGVDYIVCRSLFPNFPAGVNPMKKKEERWKDHLWPNLQGVWGGYKEDQSKEQKDPFKSGDPPEPPTPVNTQ